MFNISRIFSTLIIGLVITGANPAHATIPPFSPLHLDPQMNGVEYRDLLDHLASQNLFEVRRGDQLEEILELGKRNLDWIALINSQRGASAKLELTTPESTVGVPITAPRMSNRTLILQKRDQVRAALPAAMRQVLFEGGALTPVAPVADDVFLTAARQVDLVYQMASRWLLQEPYLSYYRAAAVTDVRGYYFLQREADLKSRLDRWTELPALDQGRYLKLLTTECRNSYKDLDECRDELNAAAKHPGGLWDFHQEYLPMSERMYDSFFRVQNPRSDVTWTDTKFTLLFQKPGSSAVESFLKNNIEDEWRLPGWNLELSFRSTGSHPQVVFVPGATPNVNGLGGDTITMDANRSLDEYLVRWTIRHEFGHVLGLPDCYVEYFDAEQGAMINYQIDTTNLMCSRTGHLLPIHFEELKRAYAH